MSGKGKWKEGKGEKNEQEQKRTKEEEGNIGRESVKSHGERGGKFEIIIGDG